MHPLLRRTWEFIESRNLIVPGEAVLLSISAGKDSVVLAHMLHALRDRIPCVLGAFHLNHLTRGDESDGDEDFVAAMAGRLGIACYMRRHDFAKNPLPGRSFEEAAREVRYSLIKEIMDREGYARAALGHTRDDNRETVLMRVFSGTGVAGLRGIEAARDRIIRPLLHLESREIYNYLEDNGLSWREDSSNRNSAHARNRIRNEVLPLVRQSFPMVDSSLERLASVASDYCALLDDYASLVAPVSGPDERGRVWVAQAPLAAARELFNYVAAAIIGRHLRNVVTGAVLDEMFANLGSGRRDVTLYRNREIMVRRRFCDGEAFLVFSPAEETGPGQWSHEVPQPGSGPAMVRVPELDAAFALEVVSPEFFAARAGDDRYVFLDAESVHGGIVIRNRRKGDSMVVSCGTKKLKDLLIEKKLDSEEKMTVPLLTIGSEIAAFMPGLMDLGGNRVSEKYRVTSDSKKVLALYRVKKEL
jgi:tRNA(Ile)-lysidine synthase